jgi:hypothetical protein
MGGASASPSVPAAAHNTGAAVAALQTFGLQLVSGGGAGAISKTSVAPIERIKVILQVERSSGSGSGAVTVARTILRTQGARAFWRGNGVNVLRIIPNAAIKFSCNDVFKGMYVRTAAAPATAYARCCVACYR